MNIILQAPTSIIEDFGQIMESFYARLLILGKLSAP